MYLNDNNKIDLYINHHHQVFLQNIHILLSKKLIDSDRRNSGKKSIKFVFKIFNLGYKESA